MLGQSCGKRKRIHNPDFGISSTLSRITTYLKSLFSTLGDIRCGRVGDEKVDVMGDFLSSIAQTNSVSDPD
jgi:hypothetical protein